MEKRKHLESNIQLPKKIRVLSGCDLYHAECMESPESRGCNSLTEKNTYSSAVRWSSLPAEQEQLQFNDKGATMHRDIGDPPELMNVKEEIAKLLNRLQELSRYADSLPGCDIIYVAVHDGTHVVGGTKAGCNFLQKVGSFIPYSFVGYLSTQEESNVPTSSSPDDDDDHSTRLDDSKDALRKSVESLFNNLYGACIGKAKIKLPYSKITEYGISIEGLPENIKLKHPSSYGKGTMKKILANKHLFQITVANGPTCTKPQNKEATNTAVSSSSTKATTTTTTTMTTTSATDSDVLRFTGSSPTNYHSCCTQMKPTPGWNVKLLQNSHVIGIGSIADGNVLHGHDIPRCSYYKN